MTEHPPPADLDRLARGTLAAPEKRRLLAHLLHRCPQCCAALARYAGLDLPGALDRMTGAHYTAAVDRAIATASRIAAPRQEALATVAVLLAGPSSGTVRPAPKLTGLRGLQRLRALLEAARGLRHEDPQAMLRFASLARTAADRLRMRDFGRDTVADLRALAWAELANAYRISNELRRADYAMGRAIYWCGRGSQEDLLLARVGDLVASLLAYERRFPEARELLDIVYRIHAETGSAHLAGRALVSRGAMSLWEGSPREALPFLLRGFDLLDPQRDPQLPLQTLWNMVTALVDMGRFRSARRHLWRGRRWFAEIVQPHRLRWVEGQIFAGLSDFPRAEVAFQQARYGFVEQGQVYPAALVGLDLAALWTRQGRIRAVFELADEMIVTFRSLRIAREAVAVLLLLKRACRYGGRILYLIDTATDLLEQLERQAPRPRPYSGLPSSPPSSRFPSS